LRIAVLALNREDIAPWGQYGLGVLAVQLRLTDLIEDELVALAGVHREDPYIVEPLCTHRASTSYAQLMILAMHRVRWGEVGWRVAGVDGQTTPLLTGRQALCQLIVAEVTRDEENWHLRNATARRWGEMIDSWDSDTLGLAYELISTRGRGLSLGDQDVEELLGAVEMVG
jgi:hypothetical protein